MEGDSRALNQHEAWAEDWMEAGGRARVRSPPPPPPPPSLCEDTQLLKTLKKHRKSHPPIYQLLKYEAVPETVDV